MRPPHEAFKGTNHLPNEFPCRSYIETTCHRDPTAAAVGDEIDILKSFADKISPPFPGVPMLAK